MDFEGLFWIALLVFYLVSRVLGGKKRQKPSPRPTDQQRPRPARTSTAPNASDSDGELDEALQEIRRALGFPVEEPTPQRGDSSVEVEAPGREVDPDALQAIEREERRRRDAQREAQRAERGSVEAQRAAEREERRREDARRAAKLEKRRREDARRAQELEERRQADARKAARQRDLQERALEAGDFTAGAKRRPTASRRPGPIGAHPVESSFAEEELFERTGRHPHDAEAVREPEADDRVRRSALKQRLRNSSSLREAYVLKELLDKPVALRRRR